MSDELTDEQLEYVVGGQTPSQFEAYRAELINEFNAHNKENGKQSTYRGTRVPILRQQRGSYYMRKLQMYILYLLRSL
tara:strand:+ start:239 stop:472 length:234 start_codon:yes stop_codon:yes gene_type:complete